MALYVANAAKTALTSGTKTILLLNPVTDSFIIRQIDISMDATAASAAVQFDLYRVATVGTPAGTSVTPALADERDTTSITTTALSWLSAEPTTVTVLASYFVQPLGGLFVLPFPYGAEVIGKPAGNRIGLRYVSTVTPNCLANIWFDE